MRRVRLAYLLTLFLHYHLATSWLAVSLPKATAPTEWSSPSATPNYIIILPEPMLHPLRLHHKVLPLAGMKSGSLINEFTIFMSSCI